MVVVPVLFFVPLRSNILFGQAYLLLFVLLLEGYIAYKRGKVLLSSLIWAIAILFKLFPVLIVLFLLLRKKYRNIAYLAVTGSLLLLLSICINGFAAWKFYLLEMFPRAGNGELNNSFAYQFQSVCMLLRSVFVYDGLLNPSPLSVQPHIAIGLLAIWKAFVITACVCVSLQRKGTDFVVFAMWITASMLISPNGSSYSLILLLLPLLAVPAITIEQGKRGGLILVVILGLLWLINIIPVYKLGNLPVLLRFPRLYVLILFFCLLLVAMKIRMHYGILALFIAVFVLTDLRKFLPDKDTSSYVLAKEEHLLMYDYRFINGLLVYYYRDGMGDSEAATGYAVSGYTTNGVRLVNNQVYYDNTQLTFTNDWKKKPMLVNNNCIFYLSDKNRGIGFYTLRKIILPSSR
ncbi:hypothetical protein F5148DRAFT_1295367 [Russula earlei]|uniref:Uncharacterized protein n=1 Tax=Russula earlei TaxID=71964 RepID=A0ACC0TSC5_9AGAM|nr:hypothetical protein F5148DRAFT_1295367 [Russula earlei]